MIMRLTLTLCCLSVVVAADNLRVTSPSGIYLGRTVTIQEGGSYNTFRGIPYAEPPVGNLRFEKPIPISKSNEEYDAREFKPFCVQMNIIANDFGEGQEDCLYLNVFTPSNMDVSSGPLKVFVFIHGGGNLNGFSDVYIPGSLVANNNIIVVTINYRLGILGFLSSGNSVSPGNYGIWDQVLALRWVKDNIEAFGGDPNAVTVGGESAGGIDTSVLSISSQAHGLFERVFPMSGATGVEHPTTVGHDATTATLMLARRDNCTSNTDTSPQSTAEWREIIECLRQIPAEKISSMEGLGDLPFLGPVMDGDLLPKEMKDLFSDQVYLEQIGFPQRDYLVSVVFNEGDLFKALQDQVISFMTPEQLEQLPPNFMYKGLVPKMLYYAYEEVSPEVIALVEQYYEENFEINPFADFGSDVIFHFPSLEYVNAASSILESRENQVYLLRFRNYPEFMTGPYKGTNHVCDLLYLFDIDPNLVNKVVDFKIDGSKWAQSDSDLKVKYQALVSSFVKTGKPVTTVSSGDNTKVDWSAYNQENGFYLEFNESPQVKQHLKAERFHLWKHQIPEWIKQFPLQKPTTKEEL